MCTLRNIVILIAAIVIQPAVVRGSYRVFTVTHDQYINDDDDEDSSAYVSGSGYDPLSYCMDDNDNCYYRSLVQALNNLTSNVLINITTDVMLSSIIPLVDLANITITGHNNPTVKCNEYGGLRFISCNNINIDGIIWKHCGYESDNNIVNNAALEFTNSSTISIENCSFQHSIGQTLVLSDVSGDCHINNSRFAYNTKYKGHGSLIHHLSTNTSTLIILNCHFEGNKKADSLVYISSSTDNHHYLCVENSTFTNNKQVIFYISNVTSYLHGYLIFKRNAKIFICTSSDIIFDDNSVIHYDSMVKSTILFLEFSRLIFTRNSVVSFKKSGDYSNSVAAIHLESHSSAIFKENSSVTFSTINNRAVYLKGYCNVTFEDNCNVTFNNNICNDNGGAMYLLDHSNVIFKGNSTVTFANNSCINGGAMYLLDNSNVIFKGNSTVTFANNSCIDGGAMYLQGCSKVIFTENCRVAFKNNVASWYGGAIFVKYQSEVIFEENSEVTFDSNLAQRLDGGAIHLDNCIVTFKGSCTTIFDSNKAPKGGAILSTSRSTVLFSGYSTVIFNNNEAFTSAGAIYGDTDNNIVLENNTKVSFTNSRANHDGGAVFIYDSSISFKEDSIVTFHNNTVNKKKSGGGALCLTGKFNVTLNGAQVNFTDNTADIGGAILGKVLLKVLWELSFPPIITFVPEDAYFSIVNSGSIYFYNNSAKTYGDSVLFITSESSLQKHLLGISKTDTQQKGLAEHFTTLPYKLVLYHPAIICNEFNNDTNCTSYQVNNVMLGQVVTIGGCVYDYFDNPVTVATKFNVDRTVFYENYNAITSIDFTIDFTCPEIQINTYIIGNEINSNINSSFTYSVMLTSITLISHWRPISLNLSIQLSPCHLGFQYSRDSQECECYNEKNIVVCSGSISTIKRGYWLGTVNEKLTVAICPIDYCDFSCCETNNGYHQLSPERENQCSSHRTGIACGNCEEGYTLSYSADCVSVDKCTVGWTVLVVTLTLLYWITIVVAVFAMMYYKVPTGYLYAITYYYSMIDVLLSQHLYLFSSLNTAVVITSSVFKISPEFLGQFCLVKGLSGIDIQFIHYIHPSAICVILIMISVLAKCSRRLSAFISRGIIHVICCLLLLSYTSVASTSLLLFRSLSLHNVDKVFTYLSPDIEYLHGRHLAYFIVAVLYTIIIVIGLPLLLLLEPFLNHKVNFTRIKPLLDQFQGCYKDQYRWFAAYYMICRLVLVTISVYSLNLLTTQYLFIIINIITIFVHITTRLYNREILNKFDSFVLVLMVFIAQLPVFELFSLITIVTMALTAMVLPLITIIVMGLIINRETIITKLLITCINVNNANVNSESPMNKSDVINNNMIHDT